MTLSHTSHPAFLTSLCTPTSPWGSVRPRGLSCLTTPLHSSSKKHRRRVCKDLLSNALNPWKVPHHYLRYKRKKSLIYHSLCSHPENTQYLQTLLFKHVTLKFSNTPQCLTCVKMSQNGLQILLGLIYSLPWTTQAVQTEPMLKWTQVGRGSFALNSGEHSGVGCCATVRSRPAVPAITCRHSSRTANKSAFCWSGFRCVRLSSLRRRQLPTRCRWFNSCSLTEKRNGF